MDIKLKDNRRYYLTQSDDDNKNKFDILVKLLNSQNPLTTANLDGVEFVEQKSKESETLVLKKVTKNGETYLQTGNMIGEFYFKASPKTVHKISIGLRFDKDDSSDMLEYLLNYSNAIYPDKVDFGTKDDKKNKTNSIIKILLSNMFTHSISKANVMGLPTIYQEMYEKDYNLRGRIDINRLISEELPFKGKTPYIRNERRVVESIGAVLLQAIEIIQHSIYSNLPNLSQIKSSIKQAGVKNILNARTIKEALTHKVLNHPSFYEYKNTLYLANLIIKGFKVPNPSEMQGLFYGYLVDVSKIWENFLVKLLEQNISEQWKVLPEPELKLFKNKPNLFELINKMYPDIVLLNEDTKKAMVFDAKFKSSQWFNREDFYKTATYISYYKNRGYEVVLSGQIYPDEDADRINDYLGFLDSDVDFRFFGIDLKEFVNLNNKNGIEFIKIIKNKIL
jgi:5-methylcytosine-specific restriction endonuclease McrBC regulatory subunit McrC